MFITGQRSPPTEGNDEMYDTRSTAQVLREMKAQATKHGSAQQQTRKGEVVLTMTEDRGCNKANWTLDGEKITQGYAKTII